jgi:Family of unknown function (DUF5681)
MVKKITPQPASKPPRQKKMPTLQADGKPAYDTGYCMPPQNKKWKKGESGNLKGRPIKEYSLDEKFAKVMCEPIPVKGPNGIEYKDPFELFAKKLTQDALTSGRIGDKKLYLSLVKETISSGAMNPKKFKEKLLIDDEFARQDAEMLKQVLGMKK